jgi:hypothetical protein
MANRRQILWSEVPVLEVEVGGDWWSEDISGANTHQTCLSAQLEPSRAQGNSTSPFGSSKDFHGFARTSIYHLFPSQAPDSFFCTVLNLPDLQNMGQFIEPPDSVL